MLNIYEIWLNQHYWGYEESSEYTIELYDLAKGIKDAWIWPLYNCDQDDWG